MNEFFKDYIIIGGIPEVVAKYVETKCKWSIINTLKI